MFNLKKLLGEEGEALLKGGAKIGKKMATNYLKNEAKQYWEDSHRQQNQITQSQSRPQLPNNQIQINQLDGSAWQNGRRVGQCFNDRTIRDAWGRPIGYW